MIQILLWKQSSEPFRNFFR